MVGDITHDNTPQCHENWPQHHATPSLLQITGKWGFKRVVMVSHTNVPAPPIGARMVPFRARVLPGPEVMVADGSNAFGPDGRLTDERYAKALDELMALLRAEAGRKA